MRVISICASRKSENGLAEKQSATRGLGAITSAALAKRFGSVENFDLANLTLPFFEGIALSKYSDQSLTSFYKVIGQADLILLQSPAYWRGPSGVVKNFLDLLGGSAYDCLVSTSTVLTGKRFALMVIGAQVGDAECSDQLLRNTLLSLGGQPLKNSFLLDNPRLHDCEKIIRSAWEFGINIGLEMLNDQS